ncbi:MAG: hypothetical protein ACOH1O_06275 [Flavobacterium sp.]
MKNIKNLVFILSIALPIIAIIDLFISYLYDIEILYGILFWFWVVIFIGGIFLLFNIKLKFFTSLFFGISFITLVVYQVLHHDFSRRKKIDKTNYQIEAYRGYYKIKENYFLFEKTISLKSSEMFAANNTKTGVVSWFEVSLMAETENKLMLEISSNLGTTRDTLDKRKFWFTEQ